MTGLETEFLSPFGPTESYRLLPSGRGICRTQHQCKGNTERRQRSKLLFFPLLENLAESPKLDRSYHFTETLPFKLFKELIKDKG